jgi:hypothetical protein
MGARSVVLLLVAFLAGLHAPSMYAAGRSTPLRAGWMRLEVPNFTIVGNAGEGELRAAASEFERFREAFAQFVPPEATATIVPTVVLVFDSDRALDAFKPIFRGRRVDAGGVFVGSTEINYIAVVAGTRSFHSIFHEYAHLVFSNVAPNQPVWLGEGLAEYYATFELRRDGRQAIIGRQIDAHLQKLRQGRLLPLNELVAVERDSQLYHEGNRRTLLYAQSWALVHYLLRGTPPRGDRLLAYMEAVETGSSPTAAWRSVFGSEEIERGFKDYLRRPELPVVEVTLPERIATRTAEAMAVTDEDADAFLGDFLLQQNRHDEAVGRLEPAAARPGGWRARTVLARLRAEQKRVADATSLLQGVRESPRDWLQDYMFGLAGSEALASDGAADGSTAAASIDALRRAVGVRPTLAHAWFVLGGLLMDTGRDLGPAVEATARARSLAPMRLDYSVRYAEALVRNGEPAKARQVLEPLLASARAASHRDQIRSLLDHVTVVERAAAEAPDVEAPRDGSGRVSLLKLREARPGEQRAAGMLSRIDCVGSFAVDVRIRGEMMRLQGSQFQDVQIVTYRDELRGDIPCGPRQPEDLVYVTWRESPDPSGVGLLVALEFLPSGYKLKPERQP